jgi:hypothetical protein
LGANKLVIFIFHPETPVHSNFSSWNIALFRGHRVGTNSPDRFGSMQSRSVKVGSAFAGAASADWRKSIQSACNGVAIGGMILNN